MAYLGNDLQVAFPTYRNIDDISGSFNGVTTSFPLTVDGVAPIPAPLNSQQCLISVNGVVQRPDDSGAEGFLLSGGNIVFASAPAGGVDFFGVILAGADYINIGANFPSGTALVPSITFDSDLDTGIYNPAGNQIGFTTAGVQRLVINSSGQVSGGLGSATTPAFSFLSDPNTGIYSPGADQVAVATNGVERLRIDSNGDLLSGTTGNLGYGGRNIILKSGQGYAGIASLATESRIFSTWDTSAIPITFFQGGTERMRLDSSGRLGVGTSSVSRLLHISAASGDTAARIQTATSGAFLEFQDSATTAGRQPLIGAIGDNLVVYTSAGSYSERVRIDSSGRLGIGTSSPQLLLDLKPSSNVSQLQLTQSNANDGWRFHADGPNGGDLYIKRWISSSESTKITVLSTGRVGIGTTSPQAILSVSDGTVTGEINPFSASSTCFFGTRTNHPISFQINASERARIDSSGRLLIGTSTARTNFENSTFSAAVQVEGTDYAGSRLALIRNGGGGGINLCGTGGASVGSNTAVSSGAGIGEISFFGSDGSEFVTGAGIQAFVDATPGANNMPGRLSFSTTAAGASSPTERMRLTAVGEFRQFSSSGAGAAGFASGNAASGNPAIILSHSASGIGGGTDSFRVNFNGDVRNTNNSYGSLSDIKLKENIVDATSQWNDLKALQVRKYNFKEETKQETHTQIGLIAQEVELVSPGLVSESPDRDEEGNDLGTVTKSVNYSVLYMKAVKALQEAMERIETLEASNADLLARVSALESA